MNMLLLLLAIDSTSIAHIAVAPRESLTVQTMLPSSSAEDSIGLPVVFLPGLLGGAFGFLKVTPDLAASGHPTFAIEPLGVGSSSHPDDGDYSLDAQADRVNAVLDTFRVVNAVTSAPPSHCVSPIVIRNVSPPWCSSKGARSIARLPEAHRSPCVSHPYSRSSAHAAWHAGTLPTRSESTPQIPRGSPTT